MIIDDKYDNEADQNTAAMPSLFKQLYSNDDYMLIGTRNKLFNITLDDLYNKESLNKVEHFNSVFFELRKYFK